jgi:hypothetical protein
MHQVGKSNNLGVCLLLFPTWCMISCFFRLVQVAKLIAFFRVFQPLLHVDMEAKRQEWSESNKSEVWLSSGLMLAHGPVEGNNDFTNFLMLGEGLECASAGPSWSHLRQKGALNHHT